MKKILLGTVGLMALGLATSANAADMRAPAYKAPAAAVAVYNWTGFYVGVTVGGQWGKSKATDLNGWNLIGDNFTADTSGFTASATAGYNYQMGNIVVGVEGDLGYLGADGSAPTQNSIGVPFDTTVVSKGGVFATARARLGYAAGPALIYVTGGYLGANLDSRIEDALGSTLFSDHTGFQHGWTVGGGLEYMINPAWSVKAEYLYYRLETATVRDPAHTTRPFDIDNSGNIVRAGVNYHFGAPVIAKY